MRRDGQNENDCTGNTKGALPVVMRKEYADALAI